MNNARAFTLIEIAIALLILAVGLVGLLALFPVGFDASARAGDITTATILAQGLIEDAKIEGFNMSIVGSGKIYGDWGNDFPNYEYEIYAWDRSSGNIYGTGFIPGIVEVVVSVYWPAGAGGPEQGSRANQQKVEIRTYVADYQNRYESNLPGGGP